MRNFLTFAGVARLYVVLGGLALATGGAAADDETFRPFPREEILLPAELGRLLSNLPRNAGIPTLPGEPSEAPPDGALPKWAEQLKSRMEEAIRKQRAEIQPTPGEPPEAPGERRDAERRHSEPSPERSEGRRAPGDPQPDAERPPSRDGPSTRFPSEPPFSSDPAHPEESPPPDWKEVFPAEPPPQPENRRGFNGPTSRDPPRNDDRPGATPPPAPPPVNVPPANVPPANVPPAAPEEQTSSPPRPARNSRKEFSEALNKIVYEAAQQAARPEAAEAVAGAASRESFLNPVVTRMRELLAKRRGGWRPERSWARDERKFISDAARRVSGAAALPEAPSDEALRGAAGTARQVVAPALFLLAILLLIPLWRRYGERLTALLKRSSSRAAFPVRRVDSPADLVQAVDRFLAAQFGRAADWWHCRAVERALTKLAPELSGDIARLTAAYELSRYGPASRPVSRYDLERSTATLRRLAEGQAGKEQSR